jgi:hypothetical protein
MTDEEDRQQERAGRLRAEDRQALLEALEEVHARVGAVRLEGGSPLLSQGWVDRRRLLLVDLAVHLCQEAVGGETLGARELAERMHSLLYVAKDLAPGHGLEEAAGRVLAALEEGAPG